MEVKLEKVVVGVNSLNAIAGLKLPVAVAFRISKILNETQGVMDIFNERREELVAKYAELKKEAGLGEKDPLPEDLVKQSNEEMKAIMEEVVELNVPQIKISDLEGQEIESHHLMTLSWLISDE